MDGVDKRLIDIAHRALEISPIDFGIPGDGGLRTAERQNELYCDGKSKCDGYDKESYHQTGKALDFYAFVNGSASWQEYHLAIVGAAFLQAANELGHRLEWGGLWKSFKDYPHVQLVG
jgi:peptidoglycan L-alanyl-D-glutamate endopeptidase CwlK